MGKLIVLIVFLIAFAVFAVFKLMIVGTKAAYKAVFDPGSDKSASEAVAVSMMLVSQFMNEKFQGRPGELSFAILQLTPMVQSIILGRGHQIDADTARSIVCRAIVQGGHATEQEIADA
jgi:hypothetical protein